jgi:myo-inositol-1(or 4)-monophosphatase
VRELLETARLAALAGGRVLESMRDSFGEVRTKANTIDFVTEADVASAASVVAAILQRDPAARFVVEEAEAYDMPGVIRGELGVDDVWLIDPLDGTTSFLHGYPTYSVAVAYVRGTEPVVGAIHNTAAGELFSAAKGLGATREGVPIRVTDAQELTDALLITGFPYDRGAPLDRQIAVLTAFLRAPIHAMRRDGSAAVDCCHVAAGRADGFWEYALQPWDMAAGAVISAEAGATVTDTDGKPWDVTCDSIVTSNPHLHTRMLAVIQAAGATTPAIR